MLSAAVFKQICVIALINSGKNRDDLQKEKKEKKLSSRKKLVMKNNSIFREILFVTTTSFSKRQLCETDAGERDSNLAPAEQLEAACWNGLVDEMLPEIMHLPFTQKLFLWQVEMRKSYLRLSMGLSAPSLEEEYTLDPYNFLYSQEMN